MENTRVLQEDLYRDSEFYKQREINKKWLRKGFPTLIPFRSFPRLSKFVPGLTLSDHVLITASSGVGKSRFTRFIMNDTIAFCKSKKVPIKVFLNSLEESKAKVEMVFVTQYLFDKYKISLSYYDLNFLMTEYNEDKELEVKINEAIAWVAAEILPSIEIVDQPNPYAFYKQVRTFLTTIGTFYNRNEKVTSFGPNKGWDRYEYNEPYIVMVITDTIDALQGYNSNGKPIDRYTAIRTFSEKFCRSLLCKKCGVISIMVSQQAEDTTRVQENFKGKTLISKLKPSLATVLSVKAVGQHVTLAFALFDPVRYEEFNYMKYKELYNLKGQFRSLLILKIRESEMPIPGEVPLICYLDRDKFKELPLPNDPELKKYYKTT